MICMQQSRMLCAKQPSIGFSIILVGYFAYIFMADRLHLTVHSVVYWKPSSDHRGVSFIEKRIEIDVEFAYRVMRAVGVVV